MNVREGNWYRCKENISKQQMFTEHRIMTEQGKYYKIDRITDYTVTIAIPTSNNFYKPTVCLYLSWDEFLSHFEEP